MILLEGITMKEFRRHVKQTKTIVFPFGTVEEHGNHLPLNTDALIIQEVLKRIVIKKNFFLAPVIYYGVCTTTRDHPGTISISSSTLQRLAKDLVIEAYKKGLRNFFLISGHGGSLHMAALKEAAEELVEKLEGIKIAAFSPYDILWKELFEIAETENDSHAGEVETSIILYLAPHLVKGRSPEEYPKIPKPFVVRDKIKYWPGGVWGDPGKASVEKGKKAVVRMAEAIGAIINQV
jgi:creatinine amidohydrolase